MCGYNPLEGMKLTGKVAKTVVRGHLVFEDVVESTLADLTDEELQTIVHNFPVGVEEKYASEFESYPHLNSAEYEKSYRKQHPEVIDEHIRGIKGIKVKPGFGQFVKRQSIQVLPRKITY